MPLLTTRRIRSLPASGASVTVLYPASLSNPTKRSSSLSSRRDESVTAPFISTPRLRVSSISGYSETAVPIRPTFPVASIPFITASFTEPKSLHRGGR